MRRAYSPVKSIGVGAVPRGFALSPNGDRLFVANSWDDTISVIDTKTLEVTATWPVGAEPSSVLEDREGKHLFVANRISNDVAVLDAQDRGGREAAGSGARGELHYIFSGWKQALCDTRISECDTASHAACIGDHGDR